MAAPISMMQKSAYDSNGKVYVLCRHNDTNVEVVGVYRQLVDLEFDLRSWVKTLSKFTTHVVPLK